MIASFLDSAFTWTETLLTFLEMFQRGEDGS